MSSVSMQVLRRCRLQNASDERLVGFGWVPDRYDAGSIVLLDDTVWIVTHRWEGCPAEDVDPEDRDSVTVLSREEPK